MKMRSLVTIFVQRTTGICVLAVAATLTVVSPAKNANTAPLGSELTGADQFVSNSTFDKASNPPSTSDKASNLTAMPGCDIGEPRKGVVRLSWTVARMPNKRQQVALTIYRRGFATNAFLTSDPLQANQQDFIWENTDPGVIHYWRILTFYEDGVAHSETARFEGATCVADFVPRRQGGPSR